MAKMGNARSSIAAGQEARRPEFTKEAMLEELRALVLVLSGHIAIAKDLDAAAGFAGFTTTAQDHDRPYAEDDPAKVDLSQFNGSRLLSRSYDYAFQIGEHHGFDETVEQSLRSLMYGFPEWGVDGHRTPYYLDGSLCRHVAEMAQARYHLDHYEGRPSIRELALLAGMSEAAVRNSLSAEGIRTEGGKPVRVENGIARKWLEQRRGYIPTVGMDNADSRTSQSSSVLRERGVGEGLLLLLRGRGYADVNTFPQLIADNCSVSVPFAKTLLEGKPMADIDALTRVGVWLALDVPHFVGVAIETALRHSMKQNTGA